jgi:hypothetical protein
MNCPQCGGLNSNDSRFCGRCGAGLAVSAPPVSLPLASLVNGESVTGSAGGLAGAVAAVLGAVGLGMAADYLVNRVAGRAIGCACGCLLLVGLLACMAAAGLIQAVQFR